MVSEEKEGTSSKDGGEDWSSYASAGFGGTDYDLWEDVAPIEEKPKPEPGQGQADEWQEDVSAEQLDTHLQEVPSAPAPGGLKHLVRIGTCDHCLGRVGGKRSFGQDMKEAGEGVRSIVIERDSNMAEYRLQDSVCPFCEELFAEAPLLAQLIADEMQEYECGRLQLGAQFPKDHTEAEDELRKRFGAPDSLPLKSSLIDEVSRCLLAINSKTKLVNEKPQILILIDMLTLAVKLDVRSHYLYGRYRKLERGIPQTRWPCRSCKGRGCQRCDQTGKQYQNSVQDLVGEPLLELFGAADHAFHGMGREDIDVRCLGRGRPFVIELKSPKIRSVEMAAVMGAINDAAAGSIEVDSMRDSQRSEVVRIKDTPAEKSYRIRFKLLPQGTLPPPEPPRGNSGRGRRGRGRRDRRRKDRNKEAETTVKAEEAQEEAAPSGLDEATLKGLKKDELVALCIENGLAKSGAKGVLIERLLSAGATAGETSEEGGSEKAEPPPIPESEAIIEILNGLAGTVLKQRTPTRVAHRRADKVRERRVIEVVSPTVEMEDGIPVAEVSLRCESGTYVKETIHGDGGRTIPCVASLLAVDCEVIWLDVADIHAD